jgi:hypothetical protein
MKTKKPVKMEKLIYKPGTLLLGAFLLLSPALKAQEELTKEFHKEYTAKQGTRLELSNKYGDIVVQTSETDQVVIDVKVTVKHPSQDRAEKLLSYIDVQFTEGADFISAKTEIDDKFNFSGWGGDARRFTIDYNVKMPEGMDLTLSNRYGNTELAVLKGFVDLDIKYGDLTASGFTRGNEKPMSTVNVSYGKANIDEAGWLDATIRYSGDFFINKSQALLLDSKYSSVRLGTVSSVVADSRYDKLGIDEIGKLVLETGYADIKIGRLTKKLLVDGSYGSINIEDVPAGFESLETDTQYMGVNIGIDGSASYNLDGHVTYGGLKFDEDNFANRKRIIENNSTEVSGIVGKDESTASTVKVEASYGTVRLY